jgi:hypothetical protein
MTDDPQRWEPVERTERKPQLGHGSKATLVVTLSRRPEPEWLRAFEAADLPREGSVTFLKARPQFEASGARLSLAIEDDDLEAAAVWIDALIDHANRDYVNRVIPAEREAAEAKQAAQDAQDQRRVDLQHRLEVLDEQSTDTAVVQDA